MRNKSKRIVAFLLSLNILITGCSKEKKSNIDMLSYVDPKDNREQMIKESIIEDISLIDSTGLKDIFGIDKEIDNILKIGDSLCTYNYYGNISSLFYRIINNSREYAKDKDIYMSLFDKEFYDDISYTNYYGVEITKDKLDLIRENVLIALESYLSYIYSTGNKEDIHNLLDLKIVVFKDKDLERLNTYGDYDSSDNLIRISFYNILESGWELDDILARMDEVLKHELNHSLEHSCEDRKGNSLEEIDFLNDNNYSFLTEAAAESALYNLGISSGYENKGSVFYYTYDEYRSLENKLLLCSIFQNDKKIEDYYRYINNEDMNGLLEFLGGSSIEEKRELFRIVYAMDALVGRNKYPYVVLGEKGEYSKEDVMRLTDKIKYQHYISILKYSIKSLIDYNLKEEVLSLDDNLLLYYIVVNNLIDDCFLIDDSSGYNIYYYYKEFIDEYNLIENSFFKILGVLYSKDVIEIESLYDEYKKIDIIDSLTYLSSGNSNIDSNKDINKRLKRLLEKFPKLKVCANVYYYNGYISNYSYIKLLDKVMNPENKDNTLRLRK
mgnify:CR=1 FL=1